MPARGSAFLSYAKFLTAVARIPTSLTVLVQFDSIMKRPASSISRTTSGKRTRGVTQLPLHVLYEKAISKAPAWEKALLHELSSLGHYPARCNRKKVTTMQALEEDQLAKRLSKRIC